MYLFLLYQLYQSILFLFYIIITSYGSSKQMVINLKTVKTVTKINFMTVVRLVQYYYKIKLCCVNSDKKSKDNQIKFVFALQFTF